MADEKEKRVYVEGVGWMPVSALEMGLVIAGVDLRGLDDIEVVDMTSDDDHGWGDIDGQGSDY